MDILGHLIRMVCRVAILLLSSTSKLGKSKIGRTSDEPDTSSFRKLGRCFENAYKKKVMGINNKFVTWEMLEMRRNLEILEFKI
jgi:hypothetical protein